MAGGAAGQEKQEGNRMLKDRMLKYRVMEYHKELVKKGQYIAARRVLRLLRDGRVALGLGDIDFSLEIQLEKIGCRIAYIGRHYTAHAYLKTA